MIYIFVFLLSLLFIYAGFRSKNKAVRKISIAIGLLIPCVVAGLRSTSVGTDTSWYVSGMYNLAERKNTLDEFITSSFNNFYTDDILYCSLTYLIAHSSLSFQFLLFLFEVLIIVPIFISLYMNREKDSDVVIGMAIFYLLAYNLSLNMVRQMIAISFVVLSFSLFMRYLKIRKRKYWLGSIALLVSAFLFHNTAIIAVPMYVLYRIFTTKKMGRVAKGIVIFISVAASIGLLVFCRDIFVFLAESGIYTKAAHYLAVYNTVSFNTMGTLFNIMLIAMVIFSKKKYIQKGDRNKYDFLFLMSIINFIISFTGLFFSYTQRLSYYIAYSILFIVVPMINIRKGKIKKSDAIFFFGTLAFFVLYWIIMILLSNRNATLPYVPYYYAP